MQFFTELTDYDITLYKNTKHYANFSPTFSPPLPLFDQQLNS